jgi:L-aspartate oxidase
MRIPLRLAAPDAGWTLDTDVVVVGSGIAGPSCALHITRESTLRVLLVMKDVLAAGSTRWAQGGIAAAIGPGDSPDQHFTDTVVAGAGLCDDAAVRTLVREGPATVRELAQLGAWRDDFPDRDDRRWRGHLDTRLAGDGTSATDFTALDPVPDSPEGALAGHGRGGVVHG